jgi:hypothetical protein
MGNIAPQTWDDARVKLLSMAAGMGWFYLLSGPESQFLPGILRAGPSILAEGVWCINTAKESHAAIEEMVAVGLIECDPDSRVIRIPKVPKHNPPGNQRVVLGWYRKWLTVPDCQLRSRHVASLYYPVDRLIRQAESKGQDQKAAAWRGVWTDTFGVVELESDEDPQPELFATKVQAPSHTPASNQESNGASNQESNTKLFNTVSNKQSTDGLTPQVSKHAPLVKQPLDRVSNVVRNESVYPDPDPDPKRKRSARGHDGEVVRPDGPGLVELLDRYRELFAEHTGHPPQAFLAPAQLDWARERLSAVGLPVCLERLEKLYHDTPHYLDGTLTFQTFERNFDRLAKARNRRPTGPPKRDPRVGYYEPDPNTKFAGGKVKL